MEMRAFPEATALLSSQRNACEWIRVFSIEVRELTDLVNEIKMEKGEREREREEFERFGV